MEYTIKGWNKGYAPEALEEIAALWNANAAGRHSFYPWHGEKLASLLMDGASPVGTLIEARTADGRLAGFSHVSRLREDGYPDAGVVEMLLVDKEHRRRGLGEALLDSALETLKAGRPRPAFVDALGAWPFGYAFNTLADGSERSGVFLNEPALCGLFKRAGFHPVKKSIVMRAELSRARPRPMPPNSGFHIAPRGEKTWLDRVFRGRELWDHDLALFDGLLLSRAIFGLMDGESAHEGRVIFSLFGVNTPRNHQGKGYAGVNLSRLMAHARDLGGEVMELHVYADNEPALALYRGLGFEPVAETMMMHKLLEQD